MPNTPTIDGYKTTYYLLCVLTGHGDTDFTEHKPIEVLPGEQLATKINDVLRWWYGDPDDPEDYALDMVDPYNVYWFFGGEFAVSEDSCMEIPKEHYDVLKLYL